jgi:hypothetical protein
VRPGHNESGERFANVGTDHQIRRIFPPTVRAAYQSIVKYLDTDQVLVSQKVVAFIDVPPFQAG